MFNLDFKSGIRRFGVPIQTNAPLEFPDMIWDPIKYYRAQEFEAMLTRAIDDDEEEEEL